MTIAIAETTPMDIPKMRANPPKTGADECSTGRLLFIFLEMISGLAGHGGAWKIIYKQVDDLFNGWFGFACTCAAVCNERRGSKEQAVWFSKPQARYIYIYNGESKIEGRKPSAC